MILKLTRSGGFGGITKEATVNTDKLPPEANAKLMKLITGIKTSRSPSLRDGFSYRLKIDDGQAIPFSDGTNSELVDLISIYA